MIDGDTQKKLIVLSYNQNVPDHLGTRKMSPQTCGPSGSSFRTREMPEPEVVLASFPFSLMRLLRLYCPYRFWNFTTDDVQLVLLSNGNGKDPVLQTTHLHGARSECETIMQPAENTAGECADPRRTSIPPLPILGRGWQTSRFDSRQAPTHLRCRDDPTISGRFRLD